MAHFFFFFHRYYGPCFPKQGRFIIFSTDISFRYVILVPSPDLATITVSYSLITAIVGYLGIPICLHSERGGELMSHWTIAVGDIGLFHKVILSLTAPGKFCD